MCWIMVSLIDGIPLNLTSNNLLNTQANIENEAINNVLFERFPYNFEN